MPLVVDPRSPEELARVKVMAEAVVKATKRIDLRRVEGEGSLDKLVRRIRPFVELAHITPEFDAYFHAEKNVDLIRVLAATLDTEGAARTNPESVGAQLSAILWQVFLFGNITAGRARKFRCCDELAQVFLHTDIKIPASELKLPFPFMIVQIPLGLINMNELDTDNVKSCQYMIITKQKMSLDDSGRFEEVEEEDCDQDRMVDNLGVMVLSETDLEDEMNELTLIDNLMLRPSKTVDEEISAYLAAKKRRRTSLPEYYNIDLEIDGTRRDPMAMMFSFAANIVLYTTNRSADVVVSNAAALRKLQERVNRLPLGKKKKRALEDLRQEQAKTVLVIGRSFKAQDQQVLRCVREPHSVAVRHMVRGHWKSQPCGPELKDRKHLFVQPYWRGPELAEVIQRDYKLVRPQ